MNNLNMNVTTQDTATQVVGNQPATNIDSQNAQALFTQEQLNSIISGRINPLNQRVQDLSSQLAQSQQLAASYLNELTGYKQRDIVTKAGVPAQFVDFVVFESNKLAVNGKSFDDAVKEYTTNNASLFGTPQMVSHPTSVSTPNIEVGTQGNVGSAQTNQVLQSNGQTGSVAQSGQSSQPIGVVPPTQVGGTFAQGGKNPTSVNNIDSEVTAFLQSRHLIK